MKKTTLAWTAIGFFVWLVIRNGRNSSRERDLSRPKKQGLTGALEQVKGAVMKSAGQVTGDRVPIVEGMVHDAIGTIKRVAGETFDSAKDKIPV